MPARSRHNSAAAPALEGLPGRAVLRSIGRPNAGAAGVAELTSRPGEDASVRVSGLRPSADGEFYELWLLGDKGKLVSLGSFAVPSRAWPNSRCRCQSTRRASATWTSRASRRTATRRTPGTRCCAARPEPGLSGDAGGPAKSAGRGADGPYRHRAPPERCRGCRTPHRRRSAGNRPRRSPPGCSPAGRSLCSETLA